MSRGTGTIQRTNSVQQVPSGTLVGADNGLTVQPGNIVYLGGTLLQDTTINTGLQYFRMNEGSKNALLLEIIGGITPAVALGDTQVNGGIVIVNNYAPGSGVNVTIGDPFGGTNNKIDFNNGTAILLGNMGRTGFLFDNNTSESSIGDVIGAGNGCLATLVDVSELFYVRFNGGDAFLVIDRSAGVYSMGDTAGTSNGTYVRADDSLALREITLSAANGIRTSPTSSGNNKLFKLGTVVAAAVAFDATRYVDVDIDGVAVRLAVVV